MKYGLIGEKLGHSFSPEIHHKLFDYDYRLCEMSGDELRSFLQKRDFCAVNITLPYKELVVPLLDELDSSAANIGAVNTIINHDGKLIGYNTDYFGLQSLLEYAGISVKGRKVLILGSGGTSKTAYAVVNDLGCSQALRVSRAGRDGCITYQQAIESHLDAQVIINTTPCGMDPDVDCSPIELSVFTNLFGVVDVIYNPLQTKLVSEADALDIPSAGGLFMLVAQAVSAAQLFTGQSITAQKLKEVYTDLLREKQNIVLIGMPASGKSSVGSKLAQLLNRPFIDTDVLIEQRVGLTIAQIFEEYGEEYFRAVEADIIAEIANQQGAVIATGGGAILNRENVSMLKRNGIIYFLDRSPEYLSISQERPLIKTAEDIKRLYDDRYELYADACDRRLSANNDVDEVVTLIVDDWGV